jgi:hypothetical protein
MLDDAWRRLQVQLEHGGVPPPPPPLLLSLVVPRLVLRWRVGWACVRQRPPDRLPRPSPQDRWPRFGLGGQSAEQGVAAAAAPEQLPGSGEGESGPLDGLRAELGASAPNGVQGPCVDVPGGWPIALWLLVGHSGGCGRGGSIAGRQGGCAVGSICHLADVATHARSMFLAAQRTMALPEAGGTDPDPLPLRVLRRCSTRHLNSWARLPGPSGRPGCYSGRVCLQ